MNKGDREWIIAGTSCIVVGGLMSLLTGRGNWFAVGGLLGAGIVGYRYCEKMSKKDKRPPELYMQTLFEEKPYFDRIGAPEIPAVDVPNVGEPEEQTRRGLVGYPVPYRVPDCEVNIDSMDDNIRPHFVGPLGPANDPVRYW